MIINDFLEHNIILSPNKMETEKKKVKYLRIVLINNRGTLASCFKKNKRFSRTDDKSKTTSKLLEFSTQKKLYPNLT